MSWRIEYVGEGVVSNAAGVFARNVAAWTDDEVLARGLAADPAWDVKGPPLAAPPAQPAEASACEVRRDEDDDFATVPDYAAGDFGFREREAAEPQERGKDKKKGK